MRSIHKVLSVALSLILIVGCTYHISAEDIYNQEPIETVIEYPIETADEDSGGIAAVENENENSESGDAAENQDENIENISTDENMDNENILDDVICVTLPENIDFNVITIGNYFPGFVDSEWYTVANRGENDVVLEIDSIYLNLIDYENFNISTTPELSDTKNNIFMELLAVCNDVSETLVVTDENTYAPFFFLLESGAELNFKFQGTANEAGTIPWGTGNITVHVNFKITPADSFTGIQNEIDVEGLETELETDISNEPDTEMDIDEEQEEDADIEPETEAGVNDAPDTEIEINEDDEIELEAETDADNELDLIPDTEPIVDLDNESDAVEEEIYIEPEFEPIIEIENEDDPVATPEETDA